MIAYAFSRQNQGNRVFRSENFALRGVVGTSAKVWLSKAARAKESIARFHISHRSEANCSPGTDNATNCARRSCLLNASAPLNEKLAASRNLQTTAYVARTLNFLDVRTSQTEVLRSQSRSISAPNYWRELLSICIIRRKN
jgi:hypothetical protein